MKNVDIAKELLKDAKTCILVKENVIYTSEKKGIAPVLGYLKEGTDLTGFSVADRIVGKAAAMLFVKAGITEAYAEVLSKDGAAFLEKYNIPYSYGTLVEKIINRQGTDICPMEKAVQNIDDIDEGITALKAKVLELQQNAQ